MRHTDAKNKDKIQKQKKSLKEKRKKKKKNQQHRNRCRQASDKNECLHPEHTETEADRATIRTDKKGEEEEIYYSQTAIDQVNVM